jgi:hypothetical protein
VREEVDPGQIQMPAQGFDIVDEVIAPVGGGGASGDAESPAPLRSRSTRKRCSVRPPRSSFC